jgi:hypothetical protein
MQILLQLWRRLPFPTMTVLVIALLVIKEQFPFSHFPMYGNMSEEADVIFITDQADKTLAMKPLFGTGGAATKKRYEAELGVLTKKDGRDSEQSTLAERQTAGSIELTGLMRKLKRENVPAGTKELRLKIRTFAYDPKVGHVNVDRPAELLATQSL